MNIEPKQDQEKYVPSPRDEWLGDWLHLFGDHLDIQTDKLTSIATAVWLIFWLLLIIAVFGGCVLVLK